MVYEAINYFLFFFHTALIVFNSIGWIFPKLRRWNLIMLLLTAFSWFVLGIWFGWGYCICTDWHWNVRWILGYHDMSSSYIHFLIRKFTGLNFSEELVNIVTAVVFFSSLVISLCLNIRDFKRKQSI
jgi:hypothetical protein